MEKHKRSLRKDPKTESEHSINKKRSTQGSIDGNGSETTDHTKIPIRDIDTWGKKHVRHYHWDPTPDFILRFLEEVWTRNKTMTIYPRDHGKTVGLCVLFLYWILEFNRSVLVIAGLPYKIWRIVFDVLEDPDIQAHYGYETKKKDENKGIYYSTKQIGEDPIFAVSGWGGKYVGSHPDWTHLEDIIQLMPVSELTSERLYMNFNDNVRDLSKRLSISGTRKDYDDFYSQLKKKHFLEIKETAIEFTKGTFPDWEDVIFEEYVAQDGSTQTIPMRLRNSYQKDVTYKILGCPRWTFEQLMFRYLDDRASFMSQFQNDPLPRGGKYFNPKYWHIIDDYEFEKIRGNCYIAVDPAFGKSSGADYFAIVIGTTTYGHLDIVKTDLEKGLSFRKATEKLRFYSQTYRPNVMWIEAEFWQALLEEEVSETVPSATPLKQEATKKTKRIDTLDSPFARGRIRVCKNMGFIEEAYDQYILYDRTESTPKRKDDWLDAVEMLWRGIKWKFGTTTSLKVKTWNE